MELQQLYEILDGVFDVENWWPSDSSFEIMVGAILTQQTSWENVSKVIDVMKGKDLLSPVRLAGIGKEELERIVRPCGFYRQKAERIQRLARFLVDKYQGAPEKLLGKDTEDARKELLSIKGIGKETADTILLFAGNHPKFVAAAYVSRIFRRTGIFDSDDYDRLQQFVEDEFSRSPEKLARLYALLIQLAKTYCKVKPLCGRCPLRNRCSYHLQKK